MVFVSECLQRTGEELYQIEGQRGEVNYQFLLNTNIKNDKKYNFKKGVI